MAGDAVALRWGVAPSAALWPVAARILFVLDGRVETSHGPRCFGLGYVLDTLRDPSFAWWVRFRVDVVRRDNGEARLTGCPQGDLNYLAPGDSVAFDTFNFRFSDESFRLDDYDQVWLFGDYPANESGPIDDPAFHPLGDDELRLLAEWMDRGGGVFATGDHFNLGASMSSRVPRVRTMRRWTQAQGVPPQDGPYRHETLQHVSGGYDDVWEGDTTPQTIEPVLQARVASILLRRWAVHPLLCAPDGVIDTFPDHMHEGEVIADDEVALDVPLDIPGYERPEYPHARPGPVAGAAASAGGLALPRPTPHVVAYGLTTNLVPDVPPVGGIAYRVLASRRRFGLVGAYDGDTAGVGRVVVDSTWHHWFSYNLHGFANAGPNVVFRRMQAYYRNVALWLATPAQRQAMLVAAAWGPVVSDPMAFPPHSSRSLWAIGERVLGIIGATASECTLYDLVASVYGSRAEEMFAVPAGIDPAGPFSDRLPPELCVRAIVGGIASALIVPARAYYQAQSNGRPRLLDPEAIERHAVGGVERGHAALVEAVRASSAATGALADRLAVTFQPPEHIRTDIELLPIRVVAERLQFPDATDPALTGARMTLTARVSLSGIVVAEEPLEVDPASSRRDGAAIELDRVLYEGVAQSGESCVLELMVGAAGRGPIPPERIRFTDTLGGAPSTWIGRHEPTRGQDWRLWYRIERSAAWHGG